MRSFFWTISARHGKERSANLKFKWRRKTYTQMNAAVRFVVIPGAYTEKMCANMCSHSALLYRLRPPTRGFCLDCKTPGSKSTGMPQIYTCGIYTGYKPVLEIWRPSLTPMVIEKNSRKHIQSRSRFRIENWKNENRISISGRSGNSLCRIGNPVSIHNTDKIFNKSERTGWLEQVPISSSG